MAPKQLKSSIISTPSLAIQWPPFPSILPHSKPLVFHTIYPEIILIPSLFPLSLLSQWQTFLNSPETPIKLQSSPIAKRGEATRTNYRFSIKDSQFAKDLWELSGLKELCVRSEEVEVEEGGLKSNRKGKKALGLNDNIRIYKYSPDEFFGPHYDDDSIDPLTGYKSEYTLLIYLTGKEDGVLGGETAFYPSGLPRNGTSKGIPKDSVIAPLERGSALLHRHGRDCLIHEGLKVEKGDKWVLRSDVMFG